MIFLVNRVIGQVHVLIVLVELGSVGFRGKTGETFLKDVHSKRLVASNDYIDSQIKLVPIYEKWVCDVSTDDTEVVDIQIVDIIKNLDTLTLARVTRLDNPNVSPWISGL